MKNKKQRLFGKKYHRSGLKQEPEGEMKNGEKWTVVGCNGQRIRTVNG
jgi:hypothetical protein